MNEEYKNMLCLLCRECATLEGMKAKQECGKRVDAAELKKHLDLLSKAKEEFLALKDSLGYTDGLGFMEDANFFGFQLKGGCVKGELKNLPKIAMSFIEKGEEDHFRYEVGILLLSHYFMQRGEYYYVEDGNVFKKCIRRCTHAFGMMRARFVRIKEYVKERAISRRFDEVDGEDWEYEYEN